MAKKDAPDYGAKKALVRKALADGGTTQAALAEKHGVSAVTISRWANEKQPRARKKRKVKAARATRNGAASITKGFDRHGTLTLTNGHALPPPSVPSLETVRDELARALATVDALREAYGRVFGGPA